MRTDHAHSDLDRDQEELLKEGEVMASLPYHDNIANLQGIAVELVHQNVAGRRGRILYQKTALFIHTSFVARSVEGKLKFYLMIQFCGSGSLKRYMELNERKMKESLIHWKYERRSLVRNLEGLSRQTSEFNNGPPQLFFDNGLNDGIGTSTLKLMLAWSHQVSLSKTQKDQKKRG